jgi:SAM-dependent methyltransferase
VLFLDRAPVMASEPAALDEPRQRIFVNAGSGPRGGGRFPSFFDNWRQLRVDVDPAAQPDIVADITDLSAIPNGSVDAIWSAHCIEHLYTHQVEPALAEFHRILRSDGFACIIVPDLQTVAEYIVSDRLDEVIYESAAGPVTAHDVLFGFGPAIARGSTSMAHRCGFTPTAMLDRLKKSRFSEIVLRRRPSLELAALALKTPSPSAADRDALMKNLAL